MADSIGRHCVAGVSLASAARRIFSVFGCRRRRLPAYRLPGATLIGEMAVCLGRTLPPDGRLAARLSIFDLISCHCRAIIVMLSQ
jgi:hypothetical protein